ncbi:MAG TPA: class I SAM-dependent methyltransferase [Methyloceanibacter sp.]|jgi:methyltransferase (TIGR00027 family)|nr:class I SAM-dependent methyltransferase [Methyloceanibacter sp.]
MLPGPPSSWRARGSAEAGALYNDPIVPLFLDERTRRGTDRVAADFPPGEQGVKLRTRYYDDRLDEQIAHGCKQIVVLGAGLDTRAVRKHAPGVTYFEIDDAETLDFKQARLAESAIVVPVVYIPGNYVTDGVLRLLTTHSFDAGLPTYLIWEGNTMYLTRPAVLGVLRDFARARG